jgi:hypothetical protein
MNFASSMIAQEIFQLIQCLGIVMIAVTINNIQPLVGMRVIQAEFVKWLCGSRNPNARF